MISCKEERNGRSKLLAVTHGEQEPVCLNRFVTDFLTVNVCSEQINATWRCRMLSNSVDWLRSMSPNLEGIVVQFMTMVKRGDTLACSLF